MPYSYKRWNILYVETLLSYHIPPNSVKQALALVNSFFSYLPAYHPTPGNIFSLKIKSLVKKIAQIFTSSETTDLLRQCL